MSGSVSQSRPSLADLLMGVPSPSAPVPLSSLRMPSDLSGVPLGSILTMPSPDVSLMQPGSMPTSRELAAQPVSQFVNPATGAFTPEGMARANDVANTAMAMGGVGPSGGGFRAFHGSPHSFDAFDASKIGTGEGAQAYGHGLYLAGNEGVARSYRDKLSTGPMDGLNNALTDFQPYNPKGPAPTMENLRAMLSDHDNPALRDAAGNDGVVRDLRTMLSGHDLNSNTWDDAAVKAASRLDTHFSKAAPAGLKSFGPVGEKGYYGWADEAGNRVGPLMTGRPPDYIFDPRELGSSIAKGAGSWKPEQAAQALQQAGIPGIRYLDAGSRGAGEGSRNSVVFDPANMEILRKYGLAGLMAGGGAAAGLQQTGGDDSQ